MGKLTEPMKLAASNARLALALLAILFSASASAENPPDKKVAEWAQEVLLGPEFGGQRICARWLKSPTLSVFGGSAEHLRVVRATVAHVNQTLSKTSIKRIQLASPSNESADILVYCVPKQQFYGTAKKHGFQYVEGNKGYFYVWWNQKHEIYKGIVLLATDQLKGRELKHFALEEITQALGPRNDSADFQDSVFYSGPAGNGNAEKLSQLDRKLLELLYSHVQPGHNQEKLRSTIQTHWFPDLVLKPDSKESKWVQQIVLGPEFGGQGRVSSRWANSPALSVFNGTGEQNRLVAKTVAHINTTLAKTPIKEIQLLGPNASEASIRVYFAPKSEFKKIAARHRFNYSGNDPGYFYTFWNGRHEIYSAYVLLASDKLKDAKLRHYTLEEIVQSLGLSNDSPEFSDSVFYETSSHFGDAESLSTRDSKLVKLFYTHIKPGSRRREVRHAFDRYWDASKAAKR